MNHRHTKIPQRVSEADEARRRFGPLFHMLMPLIHAADPLADDAARDLHASPALHATLAGALHGRPSDALPMSVQALLDDAAAVPDWVRWDRMDHAGRAFFRTGPVGGLVLGAKSLVLGYASPIGNKPLIMTGQLERDTSRRLAETGHFVAAISLPGGLKPYAPGWAVALRVRLMHAEVRRLIQTTAEWDYDDWGVPISQHDMLATSLLFSQVWIDGVRQMGIELTTKEASDWLHLWRWCSHVMGIDDTLLPHDEGQARALTELIFMTQAPPDDGARALTHALIDSGPRPDVGRALCRFLLGDTVADHLALPDPDWHDTLTKTTRAVRRIDGLMRRVPWLKPPQERLGQLYWSMAVRSGIGKKPLAFRAVDKLRRTQGHYA